MGSANPKSRFATIECLVEHGTYAIDCSPYRGTMDRVKKDGHLYSSKPPVLPTLAAGVYGAYHALTGRTLDSHEHQVVFLCIFFTVFLPHLAMLLVFWRFAARLVAREELALLALAAAAFGWLGVGYATDLNNHTPAAAFALFAFYAAHRARHDEGGPPRWYALAGFCAGVLPTIDIPSNLYSLSVAALLFATDWRRSVRWFVPASLPPLLFHFALTWSIFDGILPAYAQHDLYETELKEWSNPIPFFTYAFHAFLGHHGLFAMTPVAAFGVVGLVQTLRERRLPGFADGLAIAAPAAVSLATYLFFNRNYGGVCVGFRWYLPTTLLLLLFVGPALERARRGPLVASLFALSLGVSFFHVQDALERPWQRSRWEQLLTGRWDKPDFKDRKQVLDEKRKKERRRSPRPKASVRPATTPPPEGPAASTPQGEP